MRSKRQATKGKSINPHFWVFCEGETEMLTLFLNPSTNMHALVEALEKAKKGKVSI